MSSLWDLDWLGKNSTYDIRIGVICKQWRENDGGKGESDKKLCATSGNHQRMSFRRNQTV
jgi:hypothetical protein